MLMFPQDSFNDDIMFYNNVMNNTPKGIECTIYWNDNPSEHFGTSTYISFGSPVIHEDDVLCDEFLVDDDYIFYYFSSDEVDGLLQAIEEGLPTYSVNDEWTIALTEPYDVLYQDSQDSLK